MKTHWRTQPECFSGYNRTMEPITFDPIGTIYAVLYAMLTAMQDLFSSFLIVWILIGLDLMTGIYKSYRLGNRITSKRLSNTVAKATLLNVAILAAWLVEAQLIEQPSQYLMKSVAGFIGFTELKSILENISEATGIDWPKKILDLIKRKP